MTKTIMYGVGEAMFQDLNDKSNILAMSKLQNLTINFGAESEEIHGGDDPYPITEFPKTKSITITAQDALFDIDYLAITQGASTEEVKKAQMTEMFNVRADEDGKIQLKHKPVDGSVVVKGLELKATSSDPGAASQNAKKTFTVADKEITLPAEYKNKDVSGYYVREVEKSARSTAAFKDKFPVPFKFIHRVPVYNTENQIVQQAQLTIYKCKSDNSFEFNLQPQTAYAPQLTLKALDPKRADGKLWDFLVEDVEPQKGSFGTIG